MAVPLVSTISTPNSIRTRIIGSNQNFFLTFKKPQRSFKKSVIVSSYMFDWKLCSWGCNVSVALSVPISPGLGLRALIRQKRPQPFHLVYPLIQYLPRFYRSHSEHVWLSILVKFHFVPFAGNERWSRVTSVTAYLALYRGRCQLLICGYWGGAAPIRSLLNLEWCSVIFIPGFQSQRL